MRVEVDVRQDASPWQALQPSLDASDGVWLCSYLEQPDVNIPIHTDPCKQNTLYFKLLLLL